MNLAHLHLLLNHWPIIGSFIAVGLLLVALFTQSSDVKQAALALLAFLGLLAIPTYMSGSLVEDVLQQSNISSPMTTAHRGAALLAFVSVEITAALAWWSLWCMRRPSPRAKRIPVAVLACSIVTLGLVTLAGNTGGAIRHPEILAGESSASAVADLGVRLDAALQWVATGASRWVWPLLETLHFLGLALLLGAMGILNLRLLGIFKRFPAGPFHRLIPWALAGLALNTVTGMLFFLGMPLFYVYNADFHLKIVALVLAGGSLLLYCTSAFWPCEQIEGGQDAPFGTKLLAAGSSFLWVAVILFGRYMPLFEDTLDPRF